MLIIDKITEYLQSICSLLKSGYIDSSQVKEIVKKIFTLDDIKDPEEKIKPFIHQNDIEMAVNKIRFTANNFSDSFAEKIKKIISDIYITSW
jgi:DNA polymerase III delta prime subunit